MGFLGIEGYLLFGKKGGDRGLKTSVFRLVLGQFKPLIPI